MQKIRFILKTFLSHLKDYYAFGFSVIIFVTFLIIANSFSQLFLSFKEVINNNIPIDVVVNYSIKKNDDENFDINNNLIRDLMSINDEILANDIFDGGTAIYTNLNGDGLNYDSFRIYSLEKCFQDESYTIIGRLPKVDSNEVLIVNNLAKVVDDVNDQYIKSFEIGDTLPTDDLIELRIVGIAQYDELNGTYDKSNIYPDSLPFVVANREFLLDKFFYKELNVTSSFYTFKDESNLEFIKSHLNRIDELSNNQITVDKEIVIDDQLVNDLKKPIDDTLIINKVSNIMMILSFFLIIVLNIFYLFRKRANNMLIMNYLGMSYRQYYLILLGELLIPCVLSIVAGILLGTQIIKFIQIRMDSSSYIQEIMYSLGIYEYYFENSLHLMIDIKFLLILSSLIIVFLIVYLFIIILYTSKRLIHKV